jgi:Ion channel
MPPMLKDLLAGALVSFVNFGVHAVATGLIVVATRHTANRTDDLHLFLRLTALLTVTMVFLMIAHVSEIAVWAAYFTLAGITIKGADTFEFAFENYTALGYGDALPIDGSRLIGPIVALNGLLLIGWSVAVIFEVMRMAELQIGRDEDRSG